MSLIVDLLKQDVVDWLEINRILKDNPNIVKDSNDTELLFVAIDKNTPIDTLMLLIESWPELINVQIKAYGGLIHHRAIEKNASYDVCKLLIEKYPDGLKQKNSSGYTPLMLGVYNNTSLQIIKLLIDLDQTGVQIKNNQGSTSLHLALANNNCPIEVIKVLIESFPGACQVKNYDKCIPLHTVQFKNISTEIVKMLIDANLSSLNEKDGYGRIALHLAVEQNASLDVINLLISSSPDSPKAKTNHCLLPIHVAIEKGVRCDILKVLLEAYPEGIKSKNNSGKIPVQCGKSNINKEALALLIAADLPFEENHSYSFTLALETYKSNISLSLYIVKTIFELFHSEEPEKCQKLAYSKDNLKRTAISIVHEDVRKLMNSYILFLSRFELKEGAPEHVSKTCIVILAVDHSSNFEKVALKFMKSKDGFLRELSSRVDIDPQKVLPINCYFDSDGNSESDKFFAHYISRISSLREYRYLLVMTASDRSLANIIVHESVGNDYARIKQILRDIVICLSAVHSSSRIHGDIKPLNILRLINGHLSLIDMDASILIGSYCGVKLSTAYVPPEMIVVNNDDTYDINLQLAASISYDIWSLGCLLYFLCTGETLFQASVEDNLVDLSSWQSLHSWTQDVKLMKLSRIHDKTARNLVSQLLNKDPLKRPDTSHILTHPFLTGRVVGRLPGDLPTYDVFLSYRVSADRELVESLYLKLTAKNLKVFWDKLCLENGKNWEEGFADGLCSSGILVPIVSRAAIKSRFESLNEDSDVDNVLLEHRLALEFNMHDLITHIYPVYVGDLDSDYHYNHYFSVDCMPNSPDVVVSKLEERTSLLLDRFGLGSPLLHDLTVKGIVDRINKNNGGFVYGNDSLNIILSKLADNIEDIVKSKKNENKTNDTSITEQLIALKKQLEEKDQIIRDLLNKR